MEQYYQILGLKPGASKEEIKKAYRSKINQYHPDKDPSMEAKKKMILVDQAYDALFNDKFPTILKPKKGRKISEQKLFDKWAKVHDAPTDPIEYKQWAHVKRLQKKEKSKSDKKARYTAQELRVRNFLKSTGLYYVVAFLYIILNFLTISTSIIGGFIVIGTLFAEEFGIAVGVAIFSGIFYLANRKLKSLAFKYL